MPSSTSDTLSDPRAADRPGLRAHWLVLSAAAIVALLLLTECVLYLSLDLYLDHIESNVAISGWDFNHGVPLYELEAGAPRFANIYGPIASLAELPAFVLLGPSVFASKITAVVMLFSTIAIMWWWFDRNGIRQTAASMLFLLAGLTAMSPWSFWARADPIETLLVAGALAASAYPAIIGVCLGLAVNCKTHAFIYFFPIILEILLHRRFAALLFLAASAAATFIVPFLIPGISLHDYIVVLTQQVAGRSFTHEGLAEWLIYAILLPLPVIFALADRGAATLDRAFAIAGLASLAALLYLATYPGAGPYHLLPLIPVLAAARHRLPTTTRAARIAVLPVFVVALIAAHFCLGRMVDWRGRGALADEAVQLVMASPAQPADMGYGETEPSYKIVQLARAKLDFLGRSPTVDAQVLMELAKSGIDGSRRWIPLIERCQVRRWIVPKAEQPFATGSYYDDVRLFDEDFRRAFAARYRIVGTSDHFTIWGCDPKPG